MHTDVTFPDAIHLPDAGHFALDEAANEIAARIDAFVSARRIGKPQCYRQLAELAGASGIQSAMD